MPYQEALCEQCELQHADPKKRRNVKVVSAGEYLEKNSVEENVVLATCVHDETSVFSTKLRNRDLQIMKGWMKRGLLHVLEPEGYNKLTVFQFGKNIWQVRHSLRIRVDILYQLGKDSNKYRFVVVPRIAYRRCIRSFS